MTTTGGRHAAAKKHKRHKEKRHMKTVIVGIIGLVIGAVVGVFGFGGGGGGGGEAPGAEVATGGASQDTVRWKMASSFPGELVQLGTLGKRFEANVQTASSDSLRLKFYEPGALVPALEIFDAVSSGSLDAGWSSSGYWAGKIPALQFFAAVPFGPNPGEYLAWLQYGGGVELRQELYAAHNIHALHCGMISPEGSGWFREEINSLEDLKGLKMRFFGLGAKVMEKLGVSTQLLAGGDIFPALELGTIDATEFSMPAIDLDLGFYQIAKHYYFPGWHQPTSLLELIINKERWDALSPTHQKIIEMACGDSVSTGIAEGEAIQFGALKELQEKGVTLHRWSPEIIDALDAAWAEVVAEESAANADFARVWESLRKFREDYKLWNDLGHL
jgi:TRAP-type mannitol/chloroaromatic compound transport system substrate-binding protein